MAIQTLIKAGDTIKISKSFGIVGSAAVAGSNLPIIVVAANNNEPVTPQEMSINKPLVKMINALASIDGIIKQRLENQKIIDANERLARRESQVEQQDSIPQIEVIQPDAERVSGSNIGLFALGGLALLAFDPVQEALKTVFEGVASAGRFISSAVSSINDAFRFLLDSKVPAGAEPPTDQNTSQPSPPADTTVQAVPASPAVAAPPMQEGVPPTPTEPNMQAEPMEKPSFFGSVASSALTGAVVGSFVPKVGTVAGAVIGGAYGAYNYGFGGESFDSNSSTSTSTPAATGGAVTPPTSAPSANATTAAAVPSEIPKNDIVALGNYLVGKGAERSKMQHPAFGPVGEHSPNSRHYRGMAIDVNFPGPNEGAILDALEPQLRAAGYNTIWRKKGHTTHMHVSVGGPEGGSGGAYGDTRSLLSTATDAIGSVATSSLEQMGKLFAMIGGAVVDPGIPRTDIGGIISDAAKNLNAEVAANRSEPPAPTPPTPTMPKVNNTTEGAPNRSGGSASTDRNSVYYYLRRFGFQDLKTPESALRPAA